jgi:hypothetical protein
MSDSQGATGPSAYAVELRESVITAGKGILNLGTVTGVLYVLGAAYLSGVADGLDVPWDMMEYSLQAVLLASAQPVATGGMAVIALWAVLIGAIGVLPSRGPSG